MGSKAATLTIAALAVAAGSAVQAQNPSLRDILTGGVKRGGEAAPKPAPPKEQPANQPAAPGTSRTDTQPRPATGAGYRLNLPAGWNSELTRSQAVVARSGDRSALVVIAPVMAPASFTAGDYLRRFLAQGVQTWFPGATVTNVAPSRLGRAGALASLQYRTAAGTGHASALLFLSGGAGTLYMIGAPVDSFPSLRPTLVSILRSFSFEESRGGREGRPAGPAASAPNLSFARFTDPYEGSFSCEVPAGWNVKGGLVRKSSVDVRAFLRLNSPDGVMVFVGDPDIGSFVTPTQTLGMSGMGEGAAYGAMIVRSYIPGPQFAQQYGARMAASVGVSGMRVRDARQRPDLSGRENGIAQQAWTAGEVSFEGTRQGRPVAGYVLAATKLISMEGTGMWNVTTLVGYIAPVDQVAVPNAVIQRIMQSLRVNSQWFNQQQQTTARTSAITTEANARVSQIITDSYWSRQRAQDRASDNYSDYIRGRVRLRDNETGEELEGRSGNNYYWRVRGTDTIVGGDTPNPPPTIDVTELEQVR